MENIVAKKIVEDAQVKSAEMIEKAVESASARFENAKSQIEAEQAIIAGRLKEREDLEKLRRENSAATIARKADLGNRQAIITEVFDTVKNNIEKASAKDFQKLIAGLIAKFGQAGDTVYISKQDDKRLPATFFSTLPQKNLKRIISDTAANGIIIENDNTETRLSLDDILKTLRSDIELDLSKILF